MSGPVADLKTISGDVSQTSVQSSFIEAAQNILRQCDTLARLSSLAPPSICRTFLTDQHRAANDLVADWMRCAGMSVREDNAGSVCGRYESSDLQAPILLLGSHLDTVPNAGRYDGTLGVLLAVAAVARLQADGIRLPYHLDVIGFGDEEGVRFGATLLSSRATAGSWDNDWLALRDAAGVSLAEALETFGLARDRVAMASRRAENLLGYLEIHIEQGPVLEDRGIPLGVVTSIAGTRRLLVQVRGSAGHAGTVPMNMRRDALVGAALGIALLETIAREQGVTATVGRISCAPGALNVIPGDVEFSVDIRSGEDALRDQALQSFLDEFGRLCSLRGLELNTRQIHHADATPCTDWMQELLADAATRIGVSPIHLESGAGHDAMALASLCDVGMLFLRCRGGISHHPDESVTVEDVGISLAALLAALELLVDRQTSVLARRRMTRNPT